MLFFPSVNGAQPLDYEVTRRGDGAVVVRVRSSGGACALPDAVFAFRAGDPQYSHWEARLRQQQQGGG